MDNISLFNSPVDTADLLVKSGVKKAGGSAFKLVMMGIAAGAFIAFAAEGSNFAIHTIESVGIAKALAGALFSTGLMMVVLFGAELFTGNTLMVMALTRREISFGRMMRNWGLVYIGNFVGSVIIAALIVWSGQLDFTGGMLGAFTIKGAVYKVNLSFLKAFSMGILCNWLVCMAVWMAANSKDATGKILGIFFPIWLFITSGFEHSVANMYYIPAALFIKDVGSYAAKAVSELGVKPEALENLTWVNFLVKNLLPVTLGNIVGGGLFVGMFGLVAGKKDKQA